MFCLELLFIEGLLLFCIAVELLKMSKHLRSNYQKVMPRDHSQYLVEQSMNMLSQHNTDEATLLEKLVH